MNVWLKLNWNIYVITHSEHFVCKHCIVLYFRLFQNMGDKTHPFTVYDTFMHKGRVEKQVEIKIKKIGYD